MADRPRSKDRAEYIGLIQEKAGDPAGAIGSMKLYLLAKPKAKDADAVESKIIELEVEVERQGK